LTLTAGTTYTASFQLAGSQRGDTNTVDAAFGSTTASYTLLSADPLTPFSLSFTPSATRSYDLSFTNQGGDNFGGFLDKVQVTAVPESQTWALLVAGLAALGGVARRRRFAASASHQAAIFSRQ